MRRASEQVRCETEREKERERERVTDRRIDRDEREMGKMRER